MPEAIAILIVGFITLLIYVIARVAGRRPTPAEEREQLAARIAWLEDRAAHASANRWDEIMQTRIADQLAHARQRLAVLDGTR